MENEQLSWKPKIKNYPHFDDVISEDEAFKLATDAKKVIKHKFFPFLTYEINTKKFGTNKPKKRVINYGARKDAYIYSYYRKLLMDKYEPLLKKNGLNEHVIAYRKILYGDDHSTHGKCNIHFANDAFNEVKKRKECIAITLDIKNFFESLDHNRIKQKWCKILNVDKLDKDHFQVYKHITNYKVVDLDDCYLRLGLMTIENKNGKIKKKYKYPYDKQPKQLCDMKSFREKIAGHSSIIKNNPYIGDGEYRGIPQGSPISDVIANMYLLDFDLKLKALAENKHWYYRRYSDDILLIIPTDSNIEAVIDNVRSFVSAEGDYIALNENKTVIIKFYQHGDNTIKCEALDVDGTSKKIKNGLEYLGFSFDGKNINLKSQPIARYYKKAQRGIKALVKEAMRKTQEEGEKDISSHINISTIFHRYSIPNKKWKNLDGSKFINFLTYAQLAGQIMTSNTIKKQLKKHKFFIRNVFNEEINKSNRRLIN